MIFLNSKLLKIVQMWVMLPQEQGVEENNCIIVFFKEQGNEKWGPKEKETEGNRNSLKKM